MTHRGTLNALSPIVSERGWGGMSGIGNVAPDTHTHTHTQASLPVAQLHHVVSCCSVWSPATLCSLTGLATCLPLPNSWETTAWSASLPSPPWVSVVAQTCRHHRPATHESETCNHTCIDRSRRKLYHILNTLYLVVSCILWFICLLMFSVFVLYSLY